MGHVGGGRPAALVIESRLLVVPIPRAAPVAVIDSTGFLELSARLLRLRLRFLTMFLLKDGGQVTPWNFWRRKALVQYISQSLLTFRRILT